MIRNILVLLISLTTILAYCQTEGTESKFNFDFEQIENGIPIGWTKSYSENYTVSLDSINVKKGKYSTLIEFNEGSVDYKSFNFTIPDSYNGQKITLSGYIKTENVTDGFAGLLMKIEPNIAFNNMEDSGVKGTMDWNKYEIVLEMAPLKTEKIIFGGFLAGKGKMWLDDLTITVDGNKLEDLNPIVIPAKTDKEFDNGSLISDFNLDKTKIENLKTLGLVWGFLKYYHPNIAKGDFNWDYELFRVMPKVLNIKNKNERDSILIEWINHLGEFEESKTIENISEEIKMEPDLDWISNSNFSNELSTLLYKVKNANRTSEHFYLRIVSGYPNFINENPYESMKYTDAGFRILALYRYWNIVQYYFPYKNLIEEDWKNVLEEFIPKINNSTTETEYTLTLLELIVRINDSHAGIWGSKILKNYIGINYAAPGIKFIEDKAVITYFHDEKFGKETELEIGDVISKINSKSVESIIKSNLKLTSASNYPTKLRNIARDLLRTNDSLINIEFIRNKIVNNKTLKTYSTTEIDVLGKNAASDSYFKFVANDIAYINNGSLKAAYLTEIWKKTQNTRGLIIDNRNYPFYQTFDELITYLYPEKKQFGKFTGGSYFTPGLFTYKTSQEVPCDAGIENKDFYKGKVVILVNESTQSTSEFNTMALRQSPNAIVVGSTTAGADGNITVFYLPGKIKTTFSGVGVYYPDGRETQRIGIVPDIEVRPTIEGIKNGRDELIEKAIEVINK